MYYLNSNEYLREAFDQPIEMGERLFLAEDSPKNIYETIVCNYYLAHITGDYDLWNKLLNKKVFNDIGILIESSKDIYNNDKGIKKIEITQFKTMDIEEARQDQPLKETIMFYPGVAFEELDLDKIHNVDSYKIVKVDGNIVYMDDYFPQYPPGSFTEYFILDTQTSSRKQIKIHGISMR